MKIDLSLGNELIIPDEELEITASRSGGPGGQHVNKTDTKITVRWNVKNSKALTEEQRERILLNLQSSLTSDGDLIVSNSSSRSQLQNKEMALIRLGEIIKKSLYVPKKRKKTKISKSVKEDRLKAKARHSLIKKMRSKNFEKD